MAPEYVPAEQLVQASTLEDPNALLYVPAMQSVHWVELEEDQLPGSQEVQAAEADKEYVPAEQTLQALIDAAPAVPL